MTAFWKRHGSCSSEKTGIGARSRMRYRLLACGPRHGVPAHLCYHPLLLFNGEGDCLAVKLRPGNVHSGEGWEELLLPEIDRQQAQGKEVAFRGDAAFAKPELYEAGGEVRDPPSGQRQLGAQGCAVVDPAAGTTELQAGGAVQELFLPGGQLEAIAAGGGEGGVPLWGVVPAGGVYRDQLPDFKPGGGALLQQTWHGRTMDKGRQAGGRDDAAFLPPLPVQPAT